MTSSGLVLKQRQNIEKGERKGRRKVMRRKGKEGRGWKEKGRERREDGRREGRV